MAMKRATTGAGLIWGPASPMLKYAHPADHAAALASPEDGFDLDKALGVQTPGSGSSFGSGFGPSDGGHGDGRNGSGSGVGMHAPAPRRPSYPAPVDDDDAMPTPHPPTAPPPPSSSPPIPMPPPVPPPDRSQLLTARTPSAGAAAAAAAAAGRRRVRMHTHVDEATAGLIDTHIEEEHDDDEDYDDDDDDHDHDHMLATAASAPDNPHRKLSLTLRDRAGLSPLTTADAASLAPPPQLSPRDGSAVSAAAMASARRRSLRAAAFAKGKAPAVPTRGIGPGAASSASEEHHALRATRSLAQFWRSLPGRGGTDGGGGRIGVDAGAGAGSTAGAGASEAGEAGVSSPSARWRASARRSISADSRLDEYAGMGIEFLPAERAEEHHYDAATDSWTTREVLIKVQTESFARGAMRHCFRGKKRVLGDTDFFYIRELELSTAVRGIGQHTARRIAQRLQLRGTLTVGVLVDAAREDEAAVRAAVRGAVYSEAQRADTMDTLEAILAASREDDDRWAREPNVVVKDYIEPPGDEAEANALVNIMKEDVVLQMVSKQWAQELNSFNPPKKVDMVTATMVQLIDRKGSPTLAVEPALSGDYVKFNSNAGGVFVDRETPQAFSHFVFERSNHQLIVVDVQGVGDVYTDPQIHSSDGEGFGEGNLGIRGFSLFFSTHICSPLCRWLGLRQFRLSEVEIERVASDRRVRDQAKADVQASMTASEYGAGAPAVPSTPAADPGMLTPSAHVHAHAHAHDHDNGHGIGHGGSGSGGGGGDGDDGGGGVGGGANIHSGAEPSSSPLALRSSASPSGSDRDGGSGSHRDGTGSKRLKSLMKYATVVRTVDPFKQSFRRNGSSKAISAAIAAASRTSAGRHAAAAAAARASARRREVAAEQRRAHLSNFDMDRDVGLIKYGLIATEAAVEGRAKIRSAVHYDLAVCHAIGRIEYGTGEAGAGPMYDAILWHLRRAAEGYVEAQLQLARGYAGLGIEPLPEDLVEPDEEHSFRYYLKAAQSGESREAMVHVAQALHHGAAAGKVAPSARHAAMWFEAAAECDDGVPDTARTMLDCPNHVVLSKAAQLHADGTGDLSRDARKAAELFEAAAEAAMARGAGRAAMQFTMQAEELRGELDE